MIMNNPIKGEYYQTQGYGRTPFARSKLGRRLYRNWGGEHKGRDYGTHRINLPIIATVEGKIVKAGWSKGYGYNVEIQGKDGWRRLYAHLSYVSVKMGDIVEVGDELGKVGSTGTSTAIHLHYANRRWRGRWQYRDPIIDFTESQVEAIMPKSKLITSDKLTDRAVYVFNGKTAFPIPNWDTFLVMFKGENIEKVDADIIDKIPKGKLIPNMR